jgi:hypothetical protein
VKNKRVQPQASLRSFGGIEGDIKSMENRIVDKMDENQKWLVGLLVSAILVPLFIALVTK